MSKQVVPGSNSLYVDPSGLTRCTKHALNIRPVLTQTTAKASGTPTQTSRGLNIGYSLPIWNASDEELYWRTMIPGRWDRTTDPQFGACVSMMRVGGEDVGDKFKFQLEWQTTTASSVMGTTTSNCVSEQTVLTGRNAQHDVYFIFFTLNADDGTNPIVAGNMLQARLRRIAASANDCTGEIAVWDWTTIWPVDRMFTAWVNKENAA